MKVPWVIISLILLFFYIQQKTPDPAKLCPQSKAQKKTTIEEGAAKTVERVLTDPKPFTDPRGTLFDSIRRDLIHGSALQLIWVIIALYELVGLEQAIGSFAMLALVLWLLVLSNIIQYYSQDIIDPVLNNNEYQKTLNEITETVKLKDALPCDLGFLGITLALEVVAIYLMTTGRLKRSWTDIQWIGLQILPALLFANVTVHGQISGFAAGVLTVFFLDHLGIGH